jgi:hypothetical protein
MRDGLVDLGPWRRIGEMAAHILGEKYDLVWCQHTGERRHPAALRARRRLHALQHDFNEITGAGQMDNAAKGSRQNNRINTALKTQE